MMRYLTLVEALDLHRQIIAQSTGTLGIRDLDLLKSAIAQPRMTFGGEDLYPTVIDKAIALGFSLIMNHPFVDKQATSRSKCIVTPEFFRKTRCNSIVEGGDRMNSCAERR